LTGEYQPESILPGEMELGEQFGVSRTAVREAVKTLRQKACFYHARASARG
jgi:DNA-binding FadR family transcriptional regulator